MVLTIGSRINYLRKMCDMTQTDLGKLLGVGKTTISNYETGYSLPDAETLKKLASIFDVTTDYLLGTTGNFNILEEEVLSLNRVGNIFGERLRKLREEKGLTQLELGKMLNLSQSAIAFYESGKKQPSLETLKAIAIFFNVSIDYLLDNTNNKMSKSNQDFSERLNSLPPKERKAVEILLGLDEQSALKGEML